MGLKQKLQPVCNKIKGFLKAVCNKVKAFFKTVFRCICEFSDCW